MIVKRYKTKYVYNSSDDSDNGIYTFKIWYLFSFIPLYIVEVDSPRLKTIRSNGVNV